MSPQERLQELLFLWQRKTATGETVLVEELCRDCPELLPELQRQVAALARCNEVLAQASTLSPAANAPEADAFPSESSLTIGLPVVPGYDILDTIGRGGMGEVYKARHTALDKYVAIKRMLPGADTDRFLREARLLAKVHSPFVVTVHDFAILPDGRPILVMEWVDGMNLQRLMQARGGFIAEDEAIPMMRHVCEGMFAAARHGIVHRDLKPSNLLIDNQGRVRVADFGLARCAALESDLSEPGQALGTSYYMAPEQAEDPRGVDTRADIYSFGATFYHALTGRPPFSGATTFSVLYKHKTEPLVSPQAHRPELSERTSDILERCLAKTPADRFSSFAEIIPQLQSSEGGLSPWLASDDEELAAYQSKYQHRRERYLNESQVWNNDLDAYTFPRGQILRIVRGDIVKQRVDAIVSSDTYRLAMNYGVSGAIGAACGPEVVDEVRRLAPVRPGRAAVSRAGMLPARFIFHGVTVGIFDKQYIRPSRDLIREIMTSCFYEADSFGLRSIAFPLLGTGAQAFPRDVCLDTMFQFLARMFLRGLTSIQDARIVLYRIEET
jgi:serine/threonine protein kinase